MATSVSLCQKMDAMPNANAEYIHVYASNQTQLMLLLEKLWWWQWQLIIPPYARAASATISPSHHDLGGASARGGGREALGLPDKSKM